MRTELITKNELSEILKDIFKSLGESINERARYEHVGRDEGAALSTVGDLIGQAEPEWHVNDVLDRLDPPMFVDPTAGKTEAHGSGIKETYIDKPWTDDDTPA